MAAFEDSSSHDRAVVSARAGTIPYFSASTGPTGDSFIVYVAGFSSGAITPFNFLEPYPAVPGAPTSWLCPAPGSYAYTTCIGSSNGICEWSIYRTFNPTHAAPELHLPES